AQIIALALLKPQGMFLRPRFRGWSEMWRFGGFNALQGLATQIGTHCTALILGRRLGIEPVGYFDRASTISRHASGDLMGAVLSVAFAGMARAKTDGHALQALFWRSAANITVVFWPICGLMALLAAPTIELLFGETWLASAPLLAILAVEAAVR